MIHEYRGVIFKKIKSFFMHVVMDTLMHVRVHL